MVASLVGHFGAMARNNAWANHRLYAACAALDEAELKASRTSFFGSIHRTLSHILIVDRYYLDALLAGGRGPVLYAQEEPYARFAELRTAQQDADRRLVAYCDGLTESALDATVVLVRDSGARHPERVQNVLAYLFQHQIHHRGQVHALLSGTSVAPPQLDEFFLDEDAGRRAEDIRRLGFPSR